jgi:hypothetical protein
MKSILKISIGLIFLASLSIGSCKKQARCGCDKDIIKELEGAAVYIYYDSINNTAQFRPYDNSMATYYFCNPTDMMPALSEFDNGDLVMVDGHVYWECNYMYQASNSYSYYSYYYQAYMVTLTDIYIDLYGK